MKREKILVLILCLVLLFACQRSGKATAPVELIGVWKTTAPAYADHPFEIKTDEVIFGTGEGQFDIYPIMKIKIEKDPREQGPLYTLCYKTVEGQEYRFSFYYYPANHGTIRFKNQQEMVWTKEEAKHEKSDDQTS